MLVGQDRLAVGSDAHGKDRRGQDRVHAGLVELVDLVQVEQARDGRLVEAGFLAQLTQRTGHDSLARLERARDALPQAGQDPARRAAQQQDLELSRDRAATAEDPDVDQVGSNQSRSNRSTGRTKTVAPPTSTSSG